MSRHFTLALVGTFSLSEVIGTLEFSLSEKATLVDLVLLSLSLYVPVQFRCCLGRNATQEIRLVKL